MGAYRVVVLHSSAKLRDHPMLRHGQELKCLSDSQVANQEGNGTTANDLASSHTSDTSTQKFARGTTLYTRQLG